MAGIVTEWPSKRVSIATIKPSVVCGRNAVPLAGGLSYSFHEFGWHLLLWTALDGIKRARMRSS